MVVFTSVCFLFFVLFLNTDDGRTKPIPRKSSVEGLEPAENKCLLRATDGKRKISTVVSWSHFLMLCFLLSGPGRLKNKKKTIFSQIAKVQEQPVSMLASRMYFLKNSTDFELVI